MSNLDKIKDLREKTGLSFDQIKKALDEAEGNEEQAIKILAEQGATIAAKKLTRSTGQGIIESYIHSNKKTAAILELFCETDFVAKNSEFTELAHELAMHIVAMDPQNLEELLEQSFIKDPSTTVQELINGHIAKLGENIKVGKFSRYQI